MTGSLDDLPPRLALIEIASDFHSRGWMAGTAGNLSARSAADRFWITASGRPKGRLTEADFLEVRLDCDATADQSDPGAKPSAETAIHRIIYRLFPAAQACLHVHTVDAVLAAGHVRPTADALPLPPIEMLKGLGVWDRLPEVALALFDNLPDVAEIAARIGARFVTEPPRLPALLIRDHGVTVWGESLQQAYDRLECLEFMLSFLAKSRR